METLTALSDYELERGKPMPSLNHAVTQSRLLVQLSIRYQEAYTFLSELNLEMPERPDAVPDICIYSPLEIDFLHDQTSLATMPLTAIEIISPSQSNDEILAKFGRYFRAGVQSCWLVFPSFKAISVYTSLEHYQFFNADATLLDPSTGISLPLSSVFVS